MDSNHDLTSKRRITLFAHWDPDNKVDPYVIHYLGELSKISDISFYSDCDLPQEELDKISSLCRFRGAENHKAYDFGSYQKAHDLAKSSLEEYDELILTNDSCYGPFSPLNELFDRMDSDDFDYWGLTESLSADFGNIKHLQSYFIVMKKAVFQSAAFISFMEGVKVEADKKDVILKYEVGLSSLLQKEGFRRNALIHYDGRNISYDGSALSMVGNGELPLIKREMLAKNPCCVPRMLKRVSSITHSANRELMRLMIEHLNRFTKGDYGCAWNLFPLPGFTLLHKKFLQAKQRFKTNCHEFRLTVFGIRLVKCRFYPEKLPHQMILEQVLTSPEDKENHLCNPNEPF